MIYLTRKNHYLNLGLIIFILLFFGAFNFTREHITKPSITLSKQISAYNVNYDLINLVSFGNSRLLSSIIWTQTLLSSDIKHYKGKDLNSWLYLRFKTIATLDPYFYDNYRRGGLYLSIVKDDLRGAEKIFNLGLKNFPDDFWLNYHQGFNYYFELGEHKKAIPFFKKIKDHKLVKSHYKYIPSLLAKMIQKEAGLQEAYYILYDSYKITKNESIKKKFHQSLYAIKAEIDLECLNKNKESCSQSDFDRNPYLLKGSYYYAAKKWKPFRIKKLKKGTL